MNEDTARLEQVAADIRAQLVDPNSPIYANNPTLRDATELHVATMLKMAGVNETPKTPSDIARERHLQYWSHEDNPAFIEMMQDRKAELMQLPEAKLQEMTSDLRKTLGPQYYTLLEQAKVALGHGEVVPLVAQADLGLLRVLAAEGQFKLAKDAARAERLKY